MGSTHQTFATRQDEWCHLKTTLEHQQQLYIPRNGCFFQVTQLAPGTLQSQCFLYPEKMVPRMMILQEGSAVSSVTAEMSICNIAIFCSIIVEGTFLKAKTTECITSIRYWLLWLSGEFSPWESLHMASNYPGKLLLLNLLLIRQHFQMAKHRAQFT